MNRRPSALIHRTSPSRARLAYITACSTFVFLLAMSFPYKNWDIIPYVASAYERQGFSGEALLEKTYQDVQQFVTPGEFSSFVAGRFRKTVSQDPEALQQQLPFYEIRYVYVSLVSLVGRLVGSFALATVIVSAVFGALIVVVSGLMVAHLTSPIAFHLVPPLVAAMGAWSLARASTPDALAACLAVFSFFLIQRGRLLGAMLVIAFLPLARTDFIILSLALALYLFVRGARLAPLSFLLALLSYSLANGYAENYGYLVIFNFTLIQGPQAYPADMAVSQDILEYLRAYLDGARKLRSIVFFGIPILTLLVSVRGDSGSLSLPSHFVLISLFFISTHFLLFPAAFSRTYFLFIWSGILLLAHTYDSQRSRGPAVTAGSCRASPVSPLNRA